MEFRLIDTKYIELLKGLKYPFEYAENSFFTNETNSFWNDDELFSIPSLEMIKMWLRKTHYIHIKIECIGEKNWLPTLEFINNSKDIVVECSTPKMFGNGFDSYDDALEAAIVYAGHYIFNN